MKKMTDTFDGLFVEKEKLDEGIVNEILSERVKLTKEGDVDFQKEQGRKPTILIYLLANKVFVTKGIKPEETAAPKEIHEKTGIPKGSVGRCLQELKTENLVMNKGSKYFVPNHALTRAKSFILENEGEEK
jgi:hypothetical protein